MEIDLIEEDRLKMLEKIFGRDCDEVTIVWTN
jgi:hypothetical protein